MKVISCPVCALPLAPGASCPNFWCAREDRGFDVLWAIAPHAGPVRRAIAGLKYRHEWWQADRLGALLSSWVLEHAPCFEDVELIMGVPGTSDRSHVRQILAASTPVAQLWQVDLAGDVMAKVASTRPMVGTPSSALRRLWAAVELRPVLAVRDPSAVRGKRVLAVDDVFTDGSTLREVALALRRAGASAVSGLVLARQPQLLTSSGDRSRFHRS